jgi:hypothetical protein
MRRVWICCVSRVAVVTLEKLTESALVWECLQALGKLSRPKVTILWTPVHQGM